MGNAYGRRTMPKEGGNPSGPRGREASEREASLDGMDLKRILASLCLAGLVAGPASAAAGTTGSSG
jgi:radical SAM modification target selenobiotic family peptide